MSRVSENMRYASTNSRINQVRIAMDRTNEDAVSGRKLRSISQDPAGTVRVFRNRTKVQNIEQFRKTADFARGYLSRTEDALMGMNDGLVRARELAVQLSNSTWDKQDRSSVGEEIRQIIEECVILANTTYADKYVFGGFRSETPPLSPDGDYMGDDGVIYVQMDEGNLRPINVSSRDVLDNPEEPLATPVRSLRMMYDALKTDNLQQLRDSMRYLQESTTSVIDALSTVGARLSAIDDIQERMDKSEENYMKDSSRIEDTDYVKTSLDLRRLETGLQYTMQASAKSLTPSLMDFLK